MRRVAYRLIGLAVWKLAVQTLRRRFLATPAKLATGTVFLAVAAAVVLARRRSGDDDF